MLTGVFSTLLVPETKGRTLEELSNERQYGFVKGVTVMVETNQDGILVNERAANNP
jgi:PHS family inorganic phosphate transporter-like MFS transporter